MNDKNNITMNDITSILMI